MKVHLFGAKSSPSCATFCLRETARQFGRYFDPDVVETVMKSFMLAIVSPEPILKKELVPVSNQDD